MKRVEPGPEQESVWDYPRPPRLEATEKKVEVIFNGLTLASTMRALRLLETSHPPVYYLPPEDVAMEHLVPVPRQTFCEFKGTARYFTVQVGERRVEDAAWCYLDPTAAYAALGNYIAFYPAAMDACFVAGERVRSQDGDFYGGWITDDIVGPFKGAASTRGW